MVFQPGCTELYNADSKKPVCLLKFEAGHWEFLEGDLGDQALQQLVAAAGKCRCKGLRGKGRGSKAAESVESFRTAAGALPWAGEQARARSA